MWRGGGTWEGEWIGSIRSDGTHLTFETLTGTADSAGLRYTYFEVLDEPSGEFTAATQAGSAGWIEPTVRP